MNEIRDKYNTNPGASKITLPESYIQSGYFPKKYSYKTYRTKIFNYLDKPSGWKCLIYHLSIFALVIATLTVSALETVRQLPLTLISLYYLEIILVFIFGMEYIVRVWSAGSQSSYQNVKGRLKYCCRIANIFDLIILIGSILSLTVGASEGMLTASTLKIFRLVQIMRIARIDRRGASWDLLSSVIYNHRKELITSLYIGFLGLLITSYLVFVAENYGRSSLKFKSLADAFYWGIITVTTVGYGDITPETWLGKTVCACGSIITISFFALPAGILGSGFALKVQQKQRQKHYNKQIPAAASLIQMLWRYNRTNRSTGSNATWSMHASNAGVYRKNHMKRRRERMIQKFQKVDESNMSKFTKTQDEFSDYENYELSSKQRKQIRIIAVIQFQVARKKFKQLRNPCDVQDVIEQYSQGHFHLMIKMKDLHRKMDNTIGNVNEYKTKKENLNVIDSLEILIKKVNQLDGMVTNMYAAIMSMPHCLPDLKDKIKNSPINPELPDMDYPTSNAETSSNDESEVETKNTYLTDSNSMIRRQHAKSQYNNRFYLGHQSVLSD